MLSIPISPFLRYNPKLPRRAIDYREISKCDNLSIQNGEVTKFHGWKEITGNTFDGNVYHLAEHILNDGSRYLCALTVNSFYVYNSSNDTWYNLTRMTGGYSGSYTWSSCSYGDWFIFSNGVNEVQCWKGSTTTQAVNLSGSGGVRPLIVMTFGSHLLMINDAASASSVDSKLIKWSVPGDPEDFSGAGSGSATVYEGKGGISTALLLTRDTIAIYKTDSIHLLEYIGAPMYFSVRSSLIGIGLDSVAAVAAIGSEHYVLTNNGLRKFNGSSVEPFAPEIDPILSQYYPNKNSAYAMMLYDTFRNNLWILLPSDANVWTFTTALVYAFREQSWSRQSNLNLFAASIASIPDVTATRWQDLTVAWNSIAAQYLFWGGSNTSTRMRLVVADNNRDIFKDDGLTYTRSGATYQSVLETVQICPGLILFQTPTLYTELVQLDIGLTAGAAPTVYIGTSANGDENITWHGPYTPNANNIVFTTIVGRWFVFRLESVNAFTISSLTPWVVKRGMV